MRTTLTAPARRLALVLAAGALLATTATACEPPAPPPAFTVVTTAAGTDVTPGDGVCATAGGECSFQAAVEEANALVTKVEITVPEGDAPAVDVTVTGSIDLFGVNGSSNLQLVGLTVAEGAKLAVTDAGLGPVEVDGTLLARRVNLGGSSFAVGGVPALVEVSATGTVLLTNVHAFTSGAPLLINAGVVSLHGTSIRPAYSDPSAPPTITTLEGGLTRLSANAVLKKPDSPPLCAGVAPISYGYNLVPDTTCNLTMEGDRQDFAGDSIVPPYPFPGHEPDPRLDAIPVGTLHCGEGWTDDAIHGETAVRPSKAFVDGPGGCEIGARELYPGAP